MGKEIKCIYCNAVHTKHIEGDSYICEYCNGLNYITSSDEDFKFQLAHTKLSIYRFDEADDIYKNIFEEATNNKTKSMALMGRILSFFGVVYVKSYGSKVTTPTFAKYNPNITSIASTKLYRELCKLNIDKYYLEKYIEQIKELDKVYTRIDSDLNDTPEYDVFICTKISLRTKNDPNNDGYTVDSNRATDLYYELTKKGFNVFYSDKVLKGVEYDSQLYSALSKSKTILVIASSKEYLESVWVESEWRRWLNFINIEVRNKDTFFLHLMKDNIELPSVLQKVQVIPQYDLINVIDSVVNKDKKTNNINDDLLTQIRDLQDKIKNVTSNNNNNNNNNQTTVPPTKKGDHVHMFERKVIPATCFSEGYTELKCVDCDEIVKRDIVAKKPHTFKYRKVLPSCSSEGFEEAKCTVCGYIEKSNIQSMLPHTFQSKIVEPTCLESGYTEYKCSKCGFVKKDNYTKIGTHKIEDGKCVYCGKVFYSSGLEFVLLDDHTYELSQCKKDVTHLTVPSTYNGKKVTSISNYAIYNLKNIKQITLPNTITKISALPFKSLIYLNKKLYDNAYYIGNDENPYLVLLSVKNFEVTNCTVHPNCKIIAENAFSGSDLQSFTISNNVTHIGDEAFQTCCDLQSFNLPNDLEFIGSNAFSNCSELTTIHIPDKVKYIGVSAFTICRNLVNFTVGKNNQYFRSIDGNLCTKDGKKFIQYTIGREIESYKMPESITEICDEAFALAKFNEIILSDNLLKIGSEVFDSCPNLDYNVFDNAYYLGSSKNPYLILIKAKDDKIKTCGISLKARFIHSYAFQYCEKLTSITVPGNVLDIGERAFYSCKSLSNIRISDGVRTIQAFAFSDCASLEIIYISKSVNYIDDTGLSDIFCDSKSLKEIKVDIDNRYYSVNKDGNLYSKEKGIVIGEVKNKTNSNITTTPVTNVPKKPNVSHISTPSYRKTYDVDFFKVFNVIVSILAIISGITSFSSVLYLIAGIFESCFECSNCFYVIDIFGVGDEGIIIIGIIATIIGIISAILLHFVFDGDNLVKFTSGLVAPAVIIAAFVISMNLLSAGLSCMCDAACGWMTSIHIPIVLTSILIIILKIKSKNL